MGYDDYNYYYHYYDYNLLINYLLLTTYKLLLTDDFAHALHWMTLDLSTI